jgi:hypothetical protein
MYKSHIALIGLLISLAIILPGCLAAAVGVGAAGGVVYIKGDLEAVEAKNIDTVYAATKKAVEQLGLVITKDSKDTRTAEIITRDDEDRKTTIKLKATSLETTKLSIRVGIFGNEVRSSFIYQKIHDTLRQSESQL